jgi:hypothetical protein
MKEFFSSIELSDTELAMVVGGSDVPDFSVVDPNSGAQVSAMPGGQVQVIGGTEPGSTPAAAPSSQSASPQASSSSQASPSSNPLSMLGGLLGGL